jgi:hypothetical protein
MEIETPTLSKKLVKQKFSKVKESLLDPDIIVALRRFRGEIATLNEERLVTDIIESLDSTSLRFTPSSLNNGLMKFSFDPIRNENGDLCTVQKKYSISVCLQEETSEEDLKKALVMGFSEVAENVITGTVRNGETGRKLKKFMEEIIK